ncbi:hypothetical protein F4802DRAFT_553387 [Xylaria palmicola]|nr:hypothetical protein F4802DRAFT_553387 [Xylaria palmicola]
MPADDYVSAGTGGALKLKGAKVQKAKKKKKSSRDKDKDKGKSANLERSLSAAPGADDNKREDVAAKAASSERNVDVEVDPKAEPEPVPEYKTEAERRHEEAMKKKMQRMLEDPALASEIRKTHKERVEGLNTYLSKLSEHHDMPKIGPG